MDDVVITILVAIFSSVLGLAIIIFVVTKIIDHIKRKRLLAETSKEETNENKLKQDKEKHK